MKRNYVTVTLCITSYQYFVPRVWLHGGRQPSRWCPDITSLGCEKVVGFFDVAARVSAGDGPIASLVGGSSCSIGCAFQHRTFNDYKSNIKV